jgi:hypothetical protein
VALGKIRGWEGLVLDDGLQGSISGQGGYPMDFYSVGVVIGGSICCATLTFVDAI